MKSAQHSAWHIVGTHKSFLPLPYPYSELLGVKSI